MKLFGQFLFYVYLKSTIKKEDIFPDYLATPTAH